MNGWINLRSARRHRRHTKRQQRSKAFLYFKLVGLSSVFFVTIKAAIKSGRVAIIISMPQMQGLRPHILLLLVKKRVPFVCSRMSIVLCIYAHTGSPLIRRRLRRPIGVRHDALASRLLAFMPYQSSFFHFLSVCRCPFAID